MVDFTKKIIDPEGNYTFQLLRVLNTDSVAFVATDSDGYEQIAIGYDEIASFNEIWLVDDDENVSVQNEEETHD